MLIKREGKDDCLIAGYVVGDQKTKEYNGKEYVEFAISMGKNDKGENLPLVSITIWDRPLPFIAKGDRVLACGKLKETTKTDEKTLEEKTYYSMSADFCISETIATGNNQSKPAPKDLQPIDDDKLPF